MARGNIIKNISKSITHGERGAKKAKKAVNALKRSRKAASKGDTVKAKAAADRAYKLGRQAGRQGNKAANSVKKGARQVSGAATSAMSGNAMGAVNALGFV